jgi:CBS domain-containing protein
MKVRELMSKNVESISCESDLCEAAKIMRRLDIGVLPVTENDRVIGILTDRDIVIRCVAQDCSPSQTPVSAAMTGGTLEFLSGECEVSEAARTMAEKQVRRLLVSDESSDIVGILSLGDIAVLAHDPQLSGETLDRVSQP